MNKQAKGNRLELKVKKYIESLGYYVYKPTRTKYGVKDIAGIGDLLIIPMRDYKHHNPKMATALVQVKSHITDYYTAKKKALSIAQNMDIEIWVITYLKDTKQYKIYIVDNDLFESEKLVNI